MSLRTLESLFDYVSRDPELSNKIDIVEYEDAYILAMEAPGVKKETLSITVEDGVVSIKAKSSPIERAEDCPHKKVRDVLSERRYGAIERHFILPEDVVVKGGEVAELKDGILMVFFPKAEKAKPKQIKIR